MCRGIFSDITRCFVYLHMKFLRLVSTDTMVAENDTHNLQYAHLATELILIITLFAKCRRRLFLSVRWRRPRNIWCEIRGFLHAHVYSIGLTEFDCFTLVFVWDRLSESLRTHYTE